MKIKKLVCMLIALLILNVTMVSVSVSQPPYPNSPTIWVDDTNAQFNVEETNLTGTTFDVDVNIWNVSVPPFPAYGMGAWEFKLSFNNSLLKANSVTLGDAAVNISGNPKPWVAGAWKPIYNDFNSTHGIVWVGIVIEYGKEFNGSGSLVTIEFEIIYCPPFASPVSVSCPLDVYYWEVTDKDGIIMTSYAEDGGYEYIRTEAPPGKPNAEFLYPASVEVCTDVKLTSTSTPNGGTITSYDWDLTGPGSWISPNGYDNRTFHCDGTGTVTVTLNITDSEGMWDDVSHDILQYEVVGPNIDLFTDPERQYPEGTVTDPDKIGKGPNADCDSFAPGENITLYANVTYNKDIVQNILVGFEVKYENVTGDDWVTFLIRTDRTDENGIAKIWFRIPIPCSPEEQELLFGKWWVIAKCKLQDEIINDTMMFDAGFIVSITGLNTLPYDAWRKCELVGINVTLKNIAWIERFVHVIITIYDDCDVPIAQVIIPFYIDGDPRVCHKIVVSLEDIFLHIPKWAYIGPGKVYANVFTCLPQDCGIPYAPEVEYPIIIELGEPRI